MALGSNIKYQLQTVFETAFDPKSAKQVEHMYEEMSQRIANSSKQEFVAAFQQFGTILNNALRKLNVQPINMEELIQLPQIEAFSKLGAEFGARFAESFQGAVAGGGGINTAVQEQIQQLEAQKAQLESRLSKLPRQIEGYHKLDNIMYMDENEFSPYSEKQLQKMGGDIDSIALNLDDDFQQAQNAMKGLTQGTKEYNVALLRAYEAAGKLYKMSATLEQNPGLVKDQSILQDLNFQTLQEYNSDFFENTTNDFGNFVSRQENLLNTIPLQIQKIDAELKTLRESNPEIINRETVTTGLQSLNEIEAVYGRILNAHGKVGKQGKNIQNALNFDPTTSKEGLKSLYDAYTNMPSNSPWEVQYQALLKYVRLYESYLNSSNETHRNKVTKPGNDFTKLYEQLKPMAANAENMLQNVLNMANKMPLVGVGGTGGGAGSGSGDGTGGSGIVGNNALQQLQKDAEVASKAFEDAHNKLSSIIQAEEELDWRLTSRGLVDYAEKYQNAATMKKQEVDNLRRSFTKKSDHKSNVDAIEGVIQNLINNEALGVNGVFTSPKDLSEFTDYKFAVDTGATNKVLNGLLNSLVNKLQREVLDTMGTYKSWGDIQSRDNPDADSLIEQRRRLTKERPAAEKAYNEAANAQSEAYEKLNAAQDRSGGLDGSAGATQEEIENANKLAEVIQRVEAAYKELNALSDDPWNLKNEEEVNRILQERLAIIQRVGTENLKAHSPDMYANVELVNDEYNDALYSFRESKDDKIYNNLDDNFGYYNESIQSSQELEVLLSKRRELMQGIYFDAEREYLEQEEINKSIERRIALMKQLEPLVTSGAITRDDYEEMLFERGDLDERRNMLMGVQQNLLNAEPEDLSEAQYVLDQYEKILVQTASGKKLTLGPEMSEVDWKTFMKMDPDKAKSIEFIRKEIEATTQAQEKLNATTAKYVPVGADGKATIWGNTENIKTARDYVRNQNGFGKDVRLTVSGAEEVQQAKELDEVTKQYNGRRQQTQNILNQEKLTLENIVYLLKEYNQMYWSKLSNPNLAADAVNLEADIEKRLNGEKTFEWDNYANTMWGNLADPKITTDHFNNYAQVIAKHLGAEIPQAAQQAEGAINSVTAAQEHLNQVEGQNPPAKDDSGTHNANAEAINAENETLQQQRKIISDVVAAREGLQASQTKLGVTDGKNWLGDKNTLDIVKEKQRELKTYLQELTQIEAQEKKNGSLTEAEIARRRELVGLVRDMGLAVRYKDGSYYGTNMFGDIREDLSTQIEQLNQVLSLRKQIALGYYQTGTYGTFADTFSGEKVSNLINFGSMEGIQEFDSSIVGQLAREYQYLHEQMLRCMLVGEEVPASTLDRMKWFESMDVTQLESALPRLTELQGKIQTIQSNDFSTTLGKDEAYYDEKIKDLNTLLALQKEYMSLGGPIESIDYDKSLHYSTEELQQKINKMTSLKQGAQEIAKLKAAFPDTNLGGTPDLAEVKWQLQEGSITYDEAVAKVTQLIAAQNQLNAAKSQEPPPVDDTPQIQGEIGALDEENAKLKENINLKTQEPPPIDDTLTLQGENVKLDEQNSKLKENINLKNQANGSNVVTTGAGGTGTTPANVTPTQTVPDGTISAEAAELEAVRAKVLEVADAVNAKTQAFTKEETEVNRVVTSEISSLDLLEQKITTIKATLEGLLSNLRTGAGDIGAGLGNITVTVSNNDGAETGQNKAWALESTLQTVKGTLDSIRGDINNVISAIGNVGTQALSTSTGNIPATEGTLVSIKSVLDAINGKIANGTKTNTTNKTHSTSSETKNAESYARSQDFPEKIKTQAMYLAKFRAELMTTDRLTDDLDAQIHQLLNSLSLVQNSPDLSRWTQQFLQLKTSVGITDIFDKAADKSVVTTYKELISLQKTRNQLELQYEKAASGSALKAFYQDQLSLMNGLISNQQIINHNDEYNLQLTQMQEAHERQLGAIKAQQIDSAENAALKEQEGILKQLNQMYQEYGMLVERSGGMVGDNQKNELLSQAQSKLNEINTLRQSLTNITPEMEQGFSKSTDIGRRTEALKQYMSLAKKIDADETSRRKTILSLDKEIGTLRAKVDGATNAGVKNALEQEIQLRQDLIALQEQGLAMDAQDENYYRTKYADNTKRAKEYAKHEQKSQANTFKEAIAASQKEAGKSRANSVLNKADTTFMNAAQIPTISPEVEGQLMRYKGLIDSLQASYSKVATGDGVVTEEQKAELINQTNSVNAYTKKIQELIANYERLSGSNAEVLPRQNTLGSNATPEQYQKELTGAVQELHNGKAHIKSYDAATNTLTYSLKTGTREFTTYTASVRTADNALVTVRGTSTQAMGVFASLAAKVKQYSYYFTGSMMVYRVFGWVREGINGIKELDSAMTELKKVTDAANETYERFIDTANKIASKVGSTTKEVVSSAADWARLGYSIEQATQFAESTQVLMNVSEFTDISQATDSLISAVQAFEYTADASMDVVDVLNTIGNNYAISTADLAKSLTKSSASLVAAGGDLHEAVALTAIANATVQDADAVGTALKTTSLRLRGTSTKVLEEEGVESEGAVVSKSKLQSSVKSLSGIDILTEAGEYKSTYEILSSIADVWEDISDIDQAKYCLYVQKCA